MKQRKTQIVVMSGNAGKVSLNDLAKKKKSLT